MHARRGPGLFEGNPFDAAQPVGEQGVRAVLDPGGDVRVGRPAVGRVVLETPVRRGIVRRRDDDPVRDPAAPPGGGPGRAAGTVAGVMREYRVGDHRSGGGFVTGGDAYIHPVRGQHRQRAVTGRRGQGVRVDAEEQRPVHAVRGAVLADRLRDRDDVVGVEGASQRRTAMPGRPERDPLGGVRRVGTLVMVGGQQRVHVDEDVGWRGPARERTGRHQAVPSNRKEVAGAGAGHGHARNSSGHFSLAGWRWHGYGCFL